MFAPTNLNTHNRPDGANDPLPMNEAWQLANQQWPNPIRYIIRTAENLGTFSGEYMRAEIEKARVAATAAATMAAAAALVEANDHLDLAQADLAMANGNLEQVGTALNTMKIAARIASVIGVVFGLGFIYEKAVNYMTQSSLQDCEKDIQAAHDDAQLAMQDAQLCMQALEQN